MMMNYLITVNNKETFANKNDADALDVSIGEDSNLHVLQNDQAFKVAVVRSDFLRKTLTVSVNGNDYDIKIEDEHDQQVRKMDLLTVAAQKINSVKAPMPGLIVDVVVREGQEVVEGTPLMVLSAMKMENIILSQGNGVIKSIEVKKDDAVEKGQLIIEME